MDKSNRIIEEACKIDGLMDPEEMRAIYGWVIGIFRDPNFKGKILEIGAYKGRMTKMFALMLDSSEMAETFGSRVREFKIDAVDVFEDGNGELRPEYDPHPVHELLQNLGDVKNYVNPVRGDTLSEHTWNRLKDSYDFIFIDGDHRVEQVVNELERAEKLTKTIIGHDGNNGHVQQALRQFLEGKDYMVETAGIVNHPWIIRINK